VERTAIAFLLLGLIVAAIGIVMHVRQRASEPIPGAVRVNPPAPPPPAPLPPAPTPPATPEASAEPAVALPAPAKQPAPLVPNAETALKNGYRLRGMGAVVVLALAEETAVQLREQPDRLAELVRQGLLFTAPNQTAVEIEEVRDGLVKVRLTGSGSQERRGWVPAGLVAGLRMAK
jgi:hypothetical protein